MVLFNDWLKIPKWETKNVKFADNE
jgi:hypothetical protein